MGLGEHGLAELAKVEMIDYFKIRFVKGGPWMGAKIRHGCSCPGPHSHMVHPGIGTLISSQRVRNHKWFHKPEAEINGKPASADYVEMYGDPIDKPKFDYLVKKKAWADDQVWPAEARPYEAIDLNREPLNL